MPLVLVHKKHMGSFPYRSQSEGLISLDIFQEKATIYIIKFRNAAGDAV